MTCLNIKRITKEKDFLTSVLLTQTILDWTGHSAVEVPGWVGAEVEQVLQGIPVSEALYFLGPVPVLQGLMQQDNCNKQFN